ncbi:NUDIX domain-containing protein [Micromonospora sp. C81]|uniref:NUDIX domain-containing protein n=1 Tax=Micromonospora sp. C81 TaxID=2824881 RepID=UPI0027E106D6|nr:NUDIX domain-containing protein [Micromonospora sp. C81]
MCLRDEDLLLARWVSPDGARRHWTLPGGGVEHAEDPFDAVVREVTEETGVRGAGRAVARCELAYEECGAQRQGCCRVAHAGHLLPGPDRCR